MEFYFRGATLRLAPEVFQRRTSTMYHIPCGWTRSTRASKDAVKGHHKRGSVDAYCGCLSFLFLDGMHAYSLDVWLLN